MALSRLGIILPALLPLLLGGARSDPNAQLALGELGPSPALWLGSGTRQACRVELEHSPPPLTLFEVTRSAGGFTCFKDGRVLVFLPEEPEGCRHLERLAARQVVRLTERQAINEFRACTSSQPAGPAVMFKPVKPVNPVTPDEDDYSALWRLFTFDAEALLRHSGLPATRVVASSHGVCFEGPDPQAIERHVREARIIEDEDFGIERTEGTCADLLGWLGR